MVNERGHARLNIQFNGQRSRTAVRHTTYESNTKGPSSSSMRKRWPAKGYRVWPRTCKARDDKVPVIALLAERSTACSVPSARCRVLSAECSVLMPSARHYANGNEVNRESLLPAAAGRRCRRRMRGTCHNLIRGTPPPPLRRYLLAARQHGHEDGDATGARLTLLRVGDAEQDRVAVLRIELLEEPPRFGVLRQSGGEIVRDCGSALPIVGCLPPPVGLRALDFALAGRLHAAGGDQRIDLLAIDLRPDAPFPARRELLQKALVIRALPLPVDPAVANGHIERLRVRDRFPFRGLLGDAQPDAGRGLLIRGQPHLPRRGVRERSNGQRRLHARLPAMARASDSMLVRSRARNASSITLPSASTACRANGVRIEASCSTRPSIISSVSVSSAFTFSPPLDDALMRTIGLSWSSLLETIQSRAFFSEPGTPCAYSGLEMTKPSAHASSARKAATFGGAASPSRSRSGLKCGRSATPSYIMTSIAAGATRAAARRRAALGDLERREPEIGRTRMAGRSMNEEIRC